jgi:hypothetical protein
MSIFSIIYLPTIFHMSRFNGSLVFVYEQKAKYKLRTTAMLLLHKCYMHNFSSHGRMAVLARPPTD